MVTSPYPTGSSVDAKPSAVNSRFTQSAFVTVPRTSATHTPWDRNYPNDGRGLFITAQIDSSALWFRPRLHLRAVNHHAETSPWKFHLPVTAKTPTSIAIPFGGKAPLVAAGRGENETNCNPDRWNRCFCLLGSSFAATAFRTIWNVGLETTRFWCLCSKIRFVDSFRTDALEWIDFLNSF